MQQMDAYNAAVKAVHAYFGYVEDWRVIPLDDLRDVERWRLTGEGSGDELSWWRNGEEYCAMVYTQRFLPKWVYRGAEYTMVCIDTQTDGNKFLAILPNDKEEKQG